MKTSTIAIFYFSIFYLPLYSLAFNVQHEYQGFSETQALKFSKPSDLNSEDQLIQNAYYLPTKEEIFVRSTPRYFQYSIGSLSNNYFSILAQGNFETDLNDLTRFKFLHIQDKTLESQENRSILELERLITASVRCSMYGDPGFEKKQNDVGFSCTYWTDKNKSIRFYRTHHDFTRNDHNVKQDYFTSGKSPISNGLLARIKKDQYWSQFSLRIDEDTKWVVPEESEIYKYKAISSQAYFIKNYSINNSLQFRAQYDESIKSILQYELGSNNNYEEWDTNRLLTQASFDYHQINNNIGFTPTITYTHRSWCNTSNLRSSAQNLLVGINSRIQIKNVKYKSNNFLLGAEIGRYKKHDPHNLTGGTQKNQIYESRLNTGYEIFFKNNAKLIIAGNFDLDDWHKTPSFEGGSAQFQTEF